METSNMDKLQTEKQTVTVTDKSEEHLTCEPCTTRNEEIIATKYCRDCDERYCESCTVGHKTQKATKEHTIVDVLELITSQQQRQCEPCTINTKKNSAVWVCEQCEEFLCNECKSLHLSQRQNKNHEIKSISQQLLCEPCRNTDKKSVARYYCEDCEEPEPLCQRCSDQHKVMKLTRGHHLSLDMAMYILRYKKAEKSCKDDATPTNQDGPSCEPCNVNDKRIAATHYCEDCDESYCNNCILKHVSKKIFANHKTVKIEDIVKKESLCGPCLYNGEKHEATDRCENCEEYLCINCKRTHLSLKSTRNHTLTPVTSFIQCENCSEPGNAVQATFFCIDCTHPICDECAEDHKTMKKTKDHLLSKDMTKHVIQRKHKNDERNTMLEDRQKEVKEVEIPSPTYVAETKVEPSDKSWQIPECDPCRIDDKHVNASSYCRECGEFFCQECIDYHRAQKENKNHKANSFSTEAVMCSTCKSVNKEAAANFFCEDCEHLELLCGPCAGKHLKMKATRGHRLSQDFSCIVKRFNQTLPEELDDQLQPMADDQLLPIQGNDKWEKTYEEQSEICGKPYSTESRSDSILLQWRSVNKLKENEIYQIMYKEHPNGKWKPFSNGELCKSAKVIVDGLKSDTSYIFKVRIINESTGEEGPFTEESDIVQTHQSPAMGILKKSERVDHGPPQVYRIPIKENISGRNDSAKTRKFFLGKEGTDTTERTIMIVGATGSGKSTLINGMANYIMGVTWEDPFRFTLINLETCEQEKEHDQAHSQTEWVTCYTLHNNVSDRVNYSVNLIDTPGFGDTRGLDQDVKIIEQIRELFTATGEQGIATLDAVCFILKAPDARLTATQKYIFESILSLFGNDIKDNICTLITFADGQRPPVLSGIQALDGIPLPYETYFTFNNSALYVDNTTRVSNNLSPFFWDMGTRSCQSFFNHVSKMKTRSLTLTTEVLRKRHKLENTVNNLQQEIQVGLSKINVLEKEVELFTQNAEAILANKKFEYEVVEDFQEKIDLSGKSQFTTNCLTCNYTCHDSCVYPNDSDKAKCCAMNTEGNCTQCPKGCHWTQHHNTPYVIKWSKRKVQKRYDDMKRKYEEATQRTLTQEQVLEEMSQDITRQEQAIQVMLEVIAKINNRLKEIALRPDPMSTIQYIDLMIDSEKREMKSGFEARIDALEKCKTRAAYGESVAIFQDRVNKARNAVVAGDIAEEILKDDNSILGRIKGYFFGPPKKIKTK